jgi:hypothetical protein
MNVEGIINEIEWLETLFRLQDERPLRPDDAKANSAMHNETGTHDPAFRLWRPEDV